MLEALERPAARRVLIALVALLLIVGVVAIIDRRDDGISGDGRLRTDGVATVVRGGRAPVSVTGTFTLAAGDVVEAVKGSMTIDLPGGGELEGRAANGDGVKGTKVLVAARGGATELMVGELLASAEHGLDVDSAGNRVRLEPGVGGASAARLSRSLAVGAGVYRGSVTVDSAGQRRTVPALREVEVAAIGRAPSEPRPLKVDGSDPWDRRYLGAAIDLGTRLDALSTGYTSSLTRSDARTVGFYRSLLPALAAEPGFTQSLLDDNRDQGEILVGGAIAALGRKDAFTKRWGDVFGFRDEGAGWGLVAMDQGVSEDPLLSDLSKAVNGVGFEFAQPPGTRTAPTTPPTTGVAGPLTSGPTATTAPPTTSRPPTTAPPSPTTEPPPVTVPPLTVPPVTVPPVTVPPVTVPPTGVGPVDDLTNTVNQVVGGLLGGPPSS